MNKNLKDEDWKKVVKETAKYSITVFERAEILYQAKKLWKKFIVCDNVKETNCKQCQDYLTIILNQVNKDCLEVEDGR